MIAVEDALRRILQHAAPLPPVRRPVAEALACVLAEDVQSDIDSPPWDKSMVDGYAIRAVDLATGAAELAVLEEVIAGAVPKRAIQPGTATRIMTGAPIPEGADAIVMVERTEMRVDNRVQISDAPPRFGQNILRRGSSFARGDSIVPAQTILAPVHVGLLCEVGCAAPLVVPRPRVAVLSTGNELVGAAEVPRPGQIRNSNGPMLSAFVARSGGTPIELGVARDDGNELKRLIVAGLEADVLILSGGVSAGVLDLVPSVLAELGVEEVFHKVRLKPGKPLWFGVLNLGAQRSLVFGLPGNPVSSLVGFELFVRPTIRRLAGFDEPVHALVQAQLASEFRHRGDRATYFPARMEQSSSGGAPVVQLLPWQGSADLRGLANANGLAVFPAGEKSYQVGEQIDVLPI